MQRPHAALQLFSATLLPGEVMSSLERAAERGAGLLGQALGVFLADCIIKPLRQTLAALFSPPGCHVLSVAGPPPPCFL